jgi:RHS repeat-associated protein
MQQNYAYDSFGNLNQTSPGTLQTNLGFNGQNQIDSGGYGYDAAGNITTVFNGVGYNQYGYDAENKLVNVNSGAATYTYDANGDRVRKDVSPNWTEYVRFNGQVLAEKSSDGFWSDYIYANGQLIARADNYDIRIHMSGTNCPSCVSNPNTFVGVTSLTGANNYTVQTGDVLSWRQYQDGSTTGGLLIFFKDGTNATASTDTDGQLIDQDATMNSWHMRTIDMSPYAGKIIQLVDPFQWSGAPAGNWDIYYSDITLTSTDGTSIPIYNRAIATLSLATNQAVSNFSAITEKVATSPNPYVTTYYSGDQIGSARMLTDYGGWPVSSATYYPFGPEPTPPGDNNHYRFTGLERDQESGLDHATFRQLSSTQGRWMSPDPYDGSMNPSNPQSFNRYNYVSNNPLRFTDPSGLQQTCIANCGQPAPPNDPTNNKDNGEWYDPVDWPSMFFGLFASGPSFQGSLTPRPSNGRYCFANCGRQTPDDSVTKGPGFVYGDPSPCLVENILAVNAVSHLNVSVLNVTYTQIYNGGLDVDFSVPGGSLSMLAATRYPLSFLNSIFGLGQALHVPSAGGADPSVYGMYRGSFRFTTHIDSGYSTWHTPAGAAKHLWDDVRDQGAHRTLCGD